MSANSDDESGVWLFAYGTLQKPEVQRAVFGRRVEGEPDALPGYRLDWIEIREAGATTRYRNIVASGNADDDVAGLVLAVSEAELAMADAYEGPTNYRRIPVDLKSGRQAFVYIGDIKPALET